LLPPATEPAIVDSGLILASFVFGLYTAILFAVTQTWAGIEAPMVTGFIVDEHGPDWIEGRRRWQQQYCRTSKPGDAEALAYRRG